MKVIAVSLQDVLLKSEYRTLKDDIATAFYVPTLKEAICYKRAVGFFSSSILSMITDGLYELYKNGGHIQILASPRLSEEDIEAIKLGYTNRKAVIKSALLRELKDYDDFKTRDRLNLLACLIAERCLDFKIVEPLLHKGSGMYHEKVGLIEDKDGNVVAFSGSMNESGNSVENNYESFDVFCSWKNVDEDRVKNKEEAFSRLWEDRESNVKVYDFPEVKALFVQKYQSNSKCLHELDDENNIRLESVKEDREEYTTLDMDIKNRGFIKPEWLNLYDYQQQAIENWKNNGYRGIFDMATGTGKTYTGLAAISNLCEYVNRLVIVIVCPYQHLVDQWAEDVRRFGVSPIIGYSGSNTKNYKKRLASDLFDFRIGFKNYVCFLCTNKTFSSSSVQKELEKTGGVNVLLVVDEAHNIGAEHLRDTLNINYEFRLALSATLERYQDDGGTYAIKEFFGDKCITYDLGRAINEHKLTPYYYYPIVTHLSRDEYEVYQKITKKMVGCLIKVKGKLVLNEYGKILALKRARIVSGAIDKIIKLKNLIESKYADKKNVLIYCGATRLLKQDGEVVIDEDIRQIDYISRMLNLDCNMNTAQFTSNEDAKERAMRLQAFADGDIQALVAIKCLDEGVNVPQIETAFILASTMNPKEYIQRRGRVLRLYPGKDFSVIYDFITLPHAIEDVSSLDKQVRDGDISLVKKELSRLLEFERLAINRYEADSVYSDLIEAYELYDFDVENERIWEEL